MPAKSKAQFRLMQAMLHGSKPKGGKKGPSKKVAQEYISATPSPGKLPERVAPKAKGGKPY